MKHLIKRNQKGFTLIEMIAGIELFYIHNIL